jgi:antitoxin component of RelBE/YafQ-DinJ toxin-antitoxin module
MKTAVVNFKTDDATKSKAQAVARQIGIPLSNLLNAYLSELATTGVLHGGRADERKNGKAD